MPPAHYLTNISPSALFLSLLFSPGGSLLLRLVSVTHLLTFATWHSLPVARYLDISLLDETVISASGQGSLYIPPLIPKGDKGDKDINHPQQSPCACASLF